MPPRSFPRSAAATAVLLLAVAIAAACDDPTRVIPVPVENQPLVLFGILDPDSAVQAIWAMGTEVGGESGEIEGLTTTVRAGDSMVIEITGAEDSEKCGERYGTLATNSPAACITLPFQPEHGQTYTVLVRATGRPTANVTTRVPGDFTIRDATARGSPPGTEGLEAVWSPSAGSHAFLVAVSPAATECQDVRGCPGGWYEVTTDTAFAGTVPAESLERGSGQWHLTIYAVDRGLHDYLTSGVTGEFFPVPPTSNVTGGYGVIGSWTRRSARLF